MYHYILLSLGEIVDTTLPWVRAFAPDDKNDQRYTDNESDQMLDIADCYATSNDPGDMQHDSDGEDFSQPPDREGHLVKKVFQTQAEHTAMLLAIRNLIRP